MRAWRSHPGGAPQRRALMAQPLDAGTARDTRDNRPPAGQPVPGLLPRPLLTERCRSAWVRSVGVALAGSRPKSWPGSTSCRSIAGRSPCGGFGTGVAGTDHERQRWMRGPSSVFEAPGATARGPMGNPTPGASSLGMLLAMAKPSRPSVTQNEAVSSGQASWRRGLAAARSRLDAGSTVPSDEAVQTDFVKTADEALVDDLAVVEAALGRARARLGVVEAEIDALTSRLAELNRQRDAWGSEGFTDASDSRHRPASRASGSEGVDAG